MHGYDPITLKNNLVHKHEVEAKEREARTKAPPKKAEPKGPPKPSATSLAALNARFGRKI